MQRMENAKTFDHGVTCGVGMIMRELIPIEIGGI